jgi:hypothetical protein
MQQITGYWELLTDLTLLVFLLSNSLLDSSCTESTLRHKGLRFYAAFFPKNPQKREICEQFIRLIKLRVIGKDILSALEEDRTALNHKHKNAYKILSNRSQKNQTIWP